MLSYEPVLGRWQAALFKEGFQSEVEDGTLPLLRALLSLLDGIWGIWQLPYLVVQGETATVSVPYQEPRLS